MTIKLLKKGFIEEKKFSKLLSLVEKNQKLEKDSEWLILQEVKWQNEQLANRDLKNEKKELQNQKKLLTEEITRLKEEKRLISEEGKRIKDTLSGSNKRAFQREKDILMEKMTTRKGLLRKKEFPSEAKMHEKGFLQEKTFPKEWDFLRSQNKFDVFSSQEIEELSTSTKNIKANEQKASENKKKQEEIGTEIKEVIMQKDHINKQIKSLTKLINVKLRKRFESIEKRIKENKTKLARYHLFFEEEVRIKISGKYFRLYSPSFTVKRFSSLYELQKNEPQVISIEGKSEDFLKINQRDEDIFDSFGQRISSSRKKTLELDGKFYIYKNNLYYFDAFDTHTEDEQKLLIKEHYFKEEKKFDKLRKEIKLYQKLESSELHQSREPIPEEVKFFVWRRDGGKCVKCGSKENLEFDHIIPLSKGGSNTERNIQLLCEKCNREKSDKI